MKTFKQLTEPKEKWLGTTDPSENYYGSDSKMKDLEEQGKKIHSTGDSNIDELTSLGSYARSGHEDINSYHRKGLENFSNGISEDSRIKKIQSHTKNLDSLLNKHKTNHDLHVWRGVTIPAAKEMELGKHQVFHDKGYVSTSLDPSRSHRFITGFVPKVVENHVMHIKIPTGSKGLYVPKENPITKDEHEFLLPRNSKFRYDGSEVYKHKAGNIRIHHLTHIPEGE